MRRHEDAARGVDERLAVDDDPAAVGPDQAGDEVDQRRLAGAGAAEQRRHPAFAREARVEREVAEPLLDLDEDRHRPSIRRVDPARQRVGGEQRGEGDGDGDERQPERRRLAAGHLGVGVDRRRDGLGDAGNVADEGDRRAELAEGAGEGEHRAGEDPRQHQRQRDRQEHQEPVGAERRGRGFEPRVDRLDRQADGADQQREAHDRRGQRRAGPVEGEHDAEGVFEELRRSGRGGRRRGGAGSR